MHNENDLLQKVSCKISFDELDNMIPLRGIQQLYRRWDPSVKVQRLSIIKIESPLIIKINDRSSIRAFLDLAKLSKINP